MKKSYLFLITLLFMQCVRLLASPPSYGKLTEEQKHLVEMNRIAIQARLDAIREKSGLTIEDVQQWAVSDIYSSKNGFTYVYLQQQYNGIRVFNAVSPMVLRGGQVLTFNSRFLANLSGKVNTIHPAYSASDAVHKAAALLELPAPEGLESIETVPELNKYVFTKAGISSEQIMVTLYLLPVQNTARLVWNVTIAPVGSDHWWNLRLDALTGALLDKNDWTVHCDFGSGTIMQPAAAKPAMQSVPSAANSINTVPVYNVYAFPTQAPSFGPRVLLSNPADPTASPYGWHDTDGIPGDEFTITRGNNVHAYDDIANQDAPGTSADGGTAMNFDFPIDFTQAPSTYLDASLTNLFYVNNWAHDVLFHYGFDESAGNFQQTNYSGAGAGNDYVFAECQDGGGTNNANFSTPDDGLNGRMQMYLWSGATAADLQVNTPSSIAGHYSAIEAGFGPAITTPITADLVLVVDGAAPTSDACDPISNGAALSGKIAVIDRGTCTFISKVNAAEAAGAIAVIVCNNQAGSPISMGGTGTSNIPAVMISQADGNTLKSILSAGGSANGTLNPPAAVVQDLDGSLDNGVVAHEYGHGVSNRLTGGPNNSNCLANGEQGGEGWSDYFALMYTINVGDHGSDARGMGTYAINEPTTGSGIRRYPYSTDMTINPQTYADLAVSSEVHDIGEIWCVTLWDMSWSLIDQFGFDPDWVNGTSGNNIALQLVMEGMKLQPCGPGFLDARDAILAADDNLYGGVHKCLIWSAFARRGMGFNANQGSANTAGDETADFSLPGFCQVAVNPPTADFTADVTTTCRGTIHFTDLSTDIAQQWFWDFGDGDTSNLQNPTHAYTVSGTYTVTLIATNNLGADTLVRPAYINITSPPAPVISGITTVCSGQNTVLNIPLNPGDDAEWSDINGTLLANGATYTTPPLTASTVYNVRQFTPAPLQHVGPLNASFGTGGYHNTTFEGRELFTTYAPLKLVSVWVDASGTANRTFNLYNSTGTLIQSAVINVPAGQGRVTLDFDIPAPGDYQLGVTAGSNLYRNNAGASYPYAITGLVSITASNSTSNPATYFYYVYDWQVQELPCLSDPATVTVEVAPSPVASFNVNATGLTAMFTDNSTGNIIFYAWNFGDGSTATGAAPSHTYAQPGTYPVTLSVTTIDGCTAQITQNVTITLSGLSSPVTSDVRITAVHQHVVIEQATGGSPFTVTVTDMLGRQLVLPRNYDSRSVELSLPPLATGVVFVVVESAGKVFKQRLFVQE